jgi:AcrR family transcriptional regulator
MSEPKNTPTPIADKATHKVPKTERGRKTLRALLNAAAEEFGEKGFHDAAISQITARAGVATGSFYVYFDPATYREHYTNSATRIAARLQSAVERGEISDGDCEVRAWALMGVNVFLGLRYGVWGDEAPEDVVREAGRFITEGLARREEKP